LAICSATFLATESGDPRIPVLVLGWLSSLSSLFSGEARVVAAVVVAVGMRPNLREEEPDSLLDCKRQAFQVKMR
jgi:hypothetical protein